MSQHQTDHPQAHGRAERTARGRAARSLAWWFRGSLGRPTEPSRWASASCRWWDIVWVTLPPIALAASLHAAQLDVYQPELWVLHGVAFAWMVGAPLLARRARSDPSEAPRAASPPHARAKFWREMGIGLAAIGAVAMGIGVLVILGKVDADPPMGSAWVRTAPSSVTSEAWLWTYVAFATTLGPVAQECFYRGFLRHALGARVGVWVAGTIQIALFAGLHFKGTVTSLSLCVSGATYTALVLWRRSLPVAIMAHYGQQRVGLDLPDTRSAQALGRSVLRQDRPALPHSQNGTRLASGARPSHGRRCHRGHRRRRGRGTWRRQSHPRSATGGGCPPERAPRRHPAGGLRGDR